MVNRTASTVAPMTSSSSELALRIRGTSRDGQIVRLRSTKCTIGSGPQCTLRLRALGVGPLHCLILRGRRRTIVRRWSPDTRLNGRAFSDAPLHCGDRLTIGTIDLEVVPPGLSDDWSAEVQLQPEGFEAQRQQWEAEQRQWEERQRQWDTERQQWEAQRRQWEEERRQIESESTQQGEAIQARLADLEQQHQRWKDEQAQWEAQRRQWEEKQRQWDSERQQWEAERQQWEGERQQWEAERAETQGRHQQQLQQLEERLRELQAERESFEAERQQWEVQRQQWDTERQQIKLHSAEQGEALQVEQLPTGTPVELTEVLHRLDMVPSEDESAPSWSTPEAGTEPTPRADAHVAKPPLHLPEADDDEEESIDSYMARLLERVRNTGSSSQSVPANMETMTPPAPPPATAGSPPQSEASCRGSSGQAGEQPAAEATELAPRAVAPERSVDFSAMREVANISAQTAIDRHSLRQAIRARHSKLVVTLVATVTGAFLFWAARARGFRGVTYYATLTALAVAFLWGIQYVLLVVRAPWRASPRRGSVPASTQPPSPLDPT